MTSYCAACGASLADGARFCSACGKPISSGRLARPLAGRKVAGVCRGLAIHFGWDVTLLRVVIVLLAVLVFPLGLIAYLLLWLVMPQEMPLLPATSHLDTA